MKKLLLCILAAALLASCGKPAPPEVTPTPTSDVTPTPAPAPAPTPNPDGYPDIDALPELPPFKLDEIHTRRYREFTDELIPASDYGEIYPYIGSATRSLFGFCNARGEIITDAVFTEVMRVDGDGGAMYAFKKIPGESRGVYYDYGFGDGAEVHTYLASADGGFVIEVEDYTFYKDGIGSVKRGGKWGVIDGRGREVIPCEYDSPLYFNDGLAPVVYALDRTYAYYKYIDTNGKTVIDDLPPIPLKSDIYYEFTMYDIFAYRFSDGLAIYCDGEEYGYIDKRGEIVIPARFTPSYWSVGFFENGRAIIYGYGTGALIDKTGREIVPFGSSYITRCLSGELFVVGTENGRYVIDRDGDVVLPEELDPYELEDGWFSVRENTSNPMGLALWRDGRTYSVGAPNTLRYVNEGLFEADYGDGTGNDLRKIIRLDGSVLFDRDSFGADILYSYFVNGASFMVVGDEVDWENQRSITFDADGAVLSDSNMEQSPAKFNLKREFGDYYAVRGGFYGGLADRDDKWIVKLSLLDSYD